VRLPDAHRSRMSPERARRTGFRSGWTAREPSATRICSSWPGRSESVPPLPAASCTSSALPLRTSSPASALIRRRDRP
jgi:hypothetical protein